MATSSPLSPSATVTTTAGVTHIDLNFSAAMAKGQGTIFVTDGAIQTVIDRVTGEPTLRVVGATVTREIPVSQVTITGGTRVGFDVIGLAEGKHYNVYMGAGVLTSNGTLFAGYTVPGQIAFDVAPAPPPVVTAGFSLDETTLRAGQDIEILVTLSRAVTDLPLEAFSAENASILHVMMTEDPLTWKVVLTKNASLADAENVLTLDLSQVEIVPGVYGSGALASPAYAVDTLVGAWVSAAASAWDTGYSNEDNLTNSNVPYLRGELLGSPGDGDTIELLINGEPAPAGLVEVIRESTPVSWTYQPDDGGEILYFDEGENTITVRVKDAQGHISADYTTAITVDTMAPHIDSPDGEAGIPLNTEIVITFDEPMYYQGPEIQAMPVIVYAIDEGREYTVYCDATSILDGGMTLMLDPAELRLEAGKRYTITLSEYLTDYAGNSLAGRSIDVRTASTPDIQKPSATHAIVDHGVFYGEGAAVVAYRAGEEITFRIKFDEAIQRHGSGPLSLRLSNGQDALFERIDDDELVFSYTVAAGENVADLQIEDASSLAGKVEDLSGNVLDGAHIVFDGLYQQNGYGNLSPVMVEIDTLAPATPDAPVLADESDSGVDGDSVTNLRNPYLAGTGEPGSRVRIFEGDTEVGSADVDAFGDWSGWIWNNLGDGVHNLTVHLTDRAGNTSAMSAPLALTIDTIAAALPRPALGNDSGLTDDRITNDSTLHGSGAEANARIEILSGGEVVGFGGADAYGNWFGSFNENLPDGVHTVTVRQIDRAGNTSDDSPELTFTLDTIAPAAPSTAPDLNALSDSGVSQTDNITSERRPVFDGAGMAAGADVVLFANGVELGRTTANASGNWSFTVPAAKALADGAYAITARQVDAAGNMSADSPALSLTVDNVGPSAGPSSIGFSGGAKFILPFSEAIVFQPGGSFNLFQNGAQQQSWQGNSGNGWSISADADGDLSVLNFNISLSGLLRLQWNNGSVTDLAGNAAIVGVGFWDFQL